MTVLLLDLDGTILDREGQVHVAARDLVERGRAVGVFVALCSARPARSVREIAARVGGVDAMVSFQGAHIELAGSEASHLSGARTPLDDDSVGSLLALARDWFPIWAYTEDEWLVSEVDPLCAHEARMVGFSWSRLLMAPPSDPTLKMLVVGPHADLPEVKRAVSEVAGVRSVSSQRGYLEVVSRSLPPDKGLGRLLELVGGGSGNEVVAVGDGLNDLGMVSAADVGVTFADAPSDLRDAATWILPSDRDLAFGELSRRLLEER